MDTEKHRLGRDIHLFPSFFNNQPLVNIRYCLRNSEGVLIPQKRGITLNKQEFKKLEQLIPKVKRNIYKLEKSQGLSSGGPSQSTSGGPSQSTSENNTTGKKSDEPQKKKKKLH